MSIFGMRIYTVHVLPDVPQAGEKPVFVKEGFNLFAFLFTLFWALYQRLWVFALVILLANGLLLWLGARHVFDEAGISALQLGINLLIGFQGNDAIRARLKRSGYILADITTGDSFLRAQQRYFERYAANLAMA